jgi:phospholipid/cholesterol/gamma-HCH transport system substrate-binding protein
MRWSSFRVAALVGVVLIALIALLLVRRPFSHQTLVKAYFADAMNLRAGAAVRLAGVDIGSVKSVRVRPELKEAPAEVIMAFTPSYELRIPNDSTASLSTAGILGETYVQIDAARASGPPLQENAVLKTIPTTQLSTLEILEKLEEMVSEKCGCDSRKNADAADPSIKKRTSKASTQR